jgi:hypothetical protein
MPRILGENPDVLSVSGPVDRQLEHGADIPSPVQPGGKRSTLGDYGDIESQFA